MDPADVIGIGIDFTACTMLPVTADGTPLSMLPELPLEPARLGQALEAPRRAARGGPDQRGRPRDRAGLAGPLRRQDLVGVVLREGPPDPRRGARGLRGGRPPDRGRRLGRLAADRASRRATPAPPGYKAMWSKRDGFPDAAYFARPRPGASPTSSTTKMRRDIRQRGRAGRRALGRGGGLDRPAAGDRRGGRERRRARRRAGGHGHRAGHDGHDHGHLDLPHGPRPGRADRARHVRLRRGRRSSPAASATRPASPASATTSPGSSSSAVPERLPRRGPRPRHRHPRAAPGEGRPAASPASPGCWRSTGGTATARSWSTPTLGGLLIGATLATDARGDLPRPHRGDRLRDAGDHRDLRGQRRARPRDRRLRRPGREEPADHADLRRRHRPPVPRQRVRPDAGPRLGDVRRGRRRAPRPAATPRSRTRRARWPG